MSGTEQLVEEIEECIDGCKLQPLSNTKILVSKEELEELLTELRLRIPDEIEEYRRIIGNQDVTLSEARAQAGAMIQEASTQTNELVNEYEIMQRAYVAANRMMEQINAQAQEIVDAAASDAYNIHQNTVQYTDDVLNSLQNIIAHPVEEARDRLDAFLPSMRSSYGIVTNNRSELSGAIVQVPGEMPPTEE